MFLRGASSEGLLATLEGGYAAAAANMPEGTIRNNVLAQREEVAKLRTALREKYLTVDKDAEKELVNQILQGGGQLVSSLPAYAIPYLGPIVSGLQLYDEARQDYLQTMKEQGKPVNEAEANKAALEYLAGAGPVDVLMDKLIIGKFMKSAVKEGEKTVGGILKDLTTLATAGGLSEGAQETWLNKVANQLRGYDPDRPWTQDVVNAVMVGAGLGGAAGVVSATIPGKKKEAPAPAPAKPEGFPMPAPEERKLAEMKEKLEKQAAEKKFAPGAPVAPAPKEEEAYTAQPTSDEELARMQREYEGEEEPEAEPTTEEDEALGRAYEAAHKEPTAPAEGRETVVGPTGTRAEFQGTRFDQALSRATQLSKEDFTRAFRPIHQQFQSAATKLGLGNVKYEPSKSTAAIEFYPDGRLGLLVDPRRIMAGATITPARVDTVVAEETVHAGHLLGLKEEWNQMGGMDAMTFSEYVRSTDKELLDSIKATINAANPKERKRLLQAMTDSYAAYFGKLEQEMHHLTSDRTVENIFETIRNQGNTLNFAEEFLRQAVQLDKQGVLSEVVTTTLYDKIANWVMKALNRLVKALPGVREGHFGKAAQQEVAKIEETLSNLGIQIPELYKNKVAPAKPVPESEQDRKAREIKKRLTDAVRQGAGFREVEAITAELEQVRRQGVGLREGPATVNIGLATDDGKGITVAEALQALEDAGVEVTDYRVDQSATEPTVVAYLDKTLEEDEAFEVARALNQEAIAEQWAEGADLYGPGAEQWKPFNPAYFLAARGEPVTLARSLDDLEKLAKDYEKWKTWYEKFDAFLNRVLLPANLPYKPLVTDFMASMSQMGKISRNVDQMVAKLREFMETGSVTRKGIDFPAKPKFENLQRAMAGMPLRGPKIGPFSEAMRGVRGAAAIDRHVAMVLFGTRSPTPAQVAKGREVAAQIAARLGWDTRQVQAAWWAAGKELYGKRGTVVETYEQFLELHRDELNDILTRDREGAGRGLSVAQRVPERAGEAAGVQGTGGRETLGARAGPEVGPFRSFFGDSKVTYPNGVPKPVYHATKGDFDVFTRGDVGYHFGTVNAATDRAKHIIGMPLVMPPSEQQLPFAKGLNMMKGWLRIERPLRLTDLGSWWPDTVIPTLREMGLIKGADANARVKEIMTNWNKVTPEVTGKRMAKLIESLGYDGVVYRNTAEGRRPLTPQEREEAARRVRVEKTGQKEFPFRGVIREHGIHTLGTTEQEVRTEAERELEARSFYIDDSYIAFHPEQFKSATGNVGRYDPTRSR